MQDGVKMMFSSFRTFLGEVGLDGKEINCRNKNFRSDSIKV